MPRAGEKGCYEVLNTLPLPMSSVFAFFSLFFFAPSLFFNRCGIVKKKPEKKARHLDLLGKIYNNEKTYLKKTISLLIFQFQNFLSNLFQNRLKYSFSLSLEIVAIRGSFRFKRKTDRSIINCSKLNPICFMNSVLRSGINCCCYLNLGNKIKQSKVSACLIDRDTRRSIRRDPEEKRWTMIDSQKIGNVFAHGTAIKADS